MFDIFLDTSLVLIIQQMPSPLLQIHEKGLRSVFDNKWNNSYCVDFVGGMTNIFCFLGNWLMLSSEKNLKNYLNFQSE